MRRKKPFHNFLLLFSLIAVVIFLLVISSIYYVKLKQFFAVQKEETIQLRMDQISNEVQTKFNNMYETINNLKANEIVIRYVDELTESVLTPTEKYYQAEDLESYLYSIRQNNKLIDNILIITPKSQYSSDRKYVDYNFNGMKFTDKLESNYFFVSKGEANKIIEKSPVMEGNKQLGTDAKNLNNSMFFGANIISADGKHKGVILIVINTQNLDEYIFYADQIALYDRNGKIFFKGSQVKKAVLSEMERHFENKTGLLLKKEDTEVHYSNIPFYKFQLIYTEENDYYKKQLQSIWKVIVVTFLFTAFIAYFFSRVIGQKVLQPIYRLLSSLKEYEQSGGYKNLQQTNSKKSMKFSLRERFFFYFLFTIILPLFLFMVIFYWQTSKIVSEDLKESYHTAHEKMARVMNNEINQRELMMARIALNDNLQTHIMNREKEKIAQQLLDKKQFFELTKQNIWIYDLFGSPLYTNSYRQEKPLHFEFLNKMVNSGRSVSYTLERNLFNDIALMIGMPIYSSSDFLEVVGYITVDIDNNQLSNYYSEWRKTGLDMFMVDENNMIISHQDPLQIEKLLDEKEKLLESAYVNLPNYHGYSTKIKGPDWKFISRYNYSDIQKQVNQLFISNLYLFVIIFLLLLVFSYWISKRMLRPIGQLKELFTSFDLIGTHHEITEQLSGIDEVDSLTHNFNEMVQKMEMLIHESLEADKERIQLKYEKREIQMNALQSQINPHFLYNTLDNLIYLVESNETDKAVDMIASLSRLFRFITNREQTMITIRDELIYTKTYIKIMQYRFDNFECIFDIDEEILDYKTVKLIIQPVIENALHHGARNLKKMVIIKISGRIINDAIHFVVSDNAVGINENELIKIKSLLASAVMNKAGIYNVNGRIKLHFGNQYGLDIQSKLGEGTIVTIKMPLDK